MLKLVIGDHNYSSWSLRPWLVLKQSGLPFEEVSIRLRESNTKAEILKSLVDREKSAKGGD